MTRNSWAIFFLSFFLFLWDRVILLPRLALNFQSSSRSLPSAGITVMNQQAEL